MSLKTVGIQSLSHDESGEQIVALKKGVDNHWCISVWNQKNLTEAKTFKHGLSLLIPALKVI